MSTSVPTEPAPSGPLRRASQAIVFGFAATIAVGTLLLLTGWATSGDESTAFIDALFTATSAVSVTGLAVVDTGTHWSLFGQLVILALIQAGGLGIMTLASLIALRISARLSLRTMRAARAETKALTLTEVKKVIVRVVVFSIIMEAILAIWLAARFMHTYELGLGAATYQGIFNAVSAFNNAGFSTNANNLMPYANDALILLPMCAAVVIGGLGFPVIFEIIRVRGRRREWSILTRVTIVVTSALLVFGTAAFFIAEVRNPNTLGSMSLWHKLVNSVVGGVMPRTAGFNSVDMAELRPETLFFTNALMFIGGGSAGTAGGIKVTTFGLLAFMVWATIRGFDEVKIGDRSVGRDTQQQAVTVALLSLGAVVLGSSVMMVVSPFESAEVMFETVSAFATVGLSTGITPELSTTAKALLIVLMFTGRIGPLTLALALAHRQRARRYRVPEEKMIIG